MRLPWRRNPKASAEKKGVADDTSMPPPPPSLPQPRLRPGAPLRSADGGQTNASASQDCPTRRPSVPLNEEVAARLQSYCERHRPRPRRHTVHESGEGGGGGGGEGTQAAGGRPPVEEASGGRLGDEDILDDDGGVAAPCSEEELSSLLKFDVFEPDTRSRRWNEFRQMLDKHRDDYGRYTEALQRARGTRALSVPGLTDAAFEHWTPPPA
eukprot:GHVU01229247.1.p1 GENE.GHVU01229247.1~~GHVU01229247.1.p1  ORF type:complete len:211 (+),score=36.00 GHVU01229247.1:112-744(+)